MLVARPEARLEVKQPEVKQLEVKRREARLVVRLEAIWEAEPQVKQQEGAKSQGAKMRKIPALFTESTHGTQKVRQQRGPRLEEVNPLRKEVKVREAKETLCSHTSAGVKHLGQGVKHSERVCCRKTRAEDSQLSTLCGMVLGVEGEATSLELLLEVLARLGKGAKVLLRVQINLGIPRDRKVEGGLLRGNIVS